MYIMILDDLDLKTIESKDFKGILDAENDPE